MFIRELYTERQEIVRLQRVDHIFKGNCPEGAGQLLFYLNADQGNDTFGCIHGHPLRVLPGATGEGAVPLLLRCPHTAEYTLILSLDHMLYGCLLLYYSKKRNVNIIVIAIF